VASIYLDDCAVDHRIVRPLRAAGHVLYLPSELGVGGQSDERHLITAAQLDAVLVTHNQQDVAPLHHRWQREGRSHPGIVLVRQQLDLGTKLAALHRVARLLTAEAAVNQLLELALFATEEQAEA
jgi:hypothetical protein